jgi:transposase, IS5 family
MKRQTTDLFIADQRLQKIAQYTKVLDALNKLVDWDALTKVVNESTGRDAPQPKGGRPAYPTQALVKLIVLQQLYGNLSDEDTEYALLDRGSWQRFIGMTDALNLPDARTIWHFKNQLAQTKTSTALFADVQRQLNAAGLEAKGGQMIDATIVPAPKMHFTKDEKQRLAEGKTPDNWSAKQIAHKDTDAGWTAKHGQWQHGYKAHANADQKHKLIRIVDITSASKSDMTHFAPIIDTTAERKQTGKTVHADRGYDSGANRQTLKANALRDAISRKDDRKRFDQTEIHARNKRLGRIRARVEHIFGAWQQVIGKSIRCIGLVRATSQITMQAVVVNLRRWVTLNAQSGACA